jgi:hypothetical protein
MLVREQFGFSSRLLILCEEHRLKISENKGAEENIWTEDAGGRWRKFHNEMLHNLYSAPNIRRMSWTKRVAEGEIRN